MKRITLAAALLCTLLPLSASALPSWIAIMPNDVIGKWRNDSDKKQIITIARNGSALTLHTVKYSDWDPMPAGKDTISRIAFSRWVTKDDIRDARRIKGKDPLPEAVVERAANHNIIERFSGTLKRHTVHVLWGKSCKLTMSGSFTGFDIEWKPDTVDDYNETSYNQKVDFTQIRYEWPDLRRSETEVRYDGSSSTANSDLYAYFTEHPAMQVYGEFGAAIFKSIYSGVAGVVPAETLLGKFAASLIGKAGEQAIKGETLSGKDLASVVAGQVLDKVLEGVPESDEPLETFKGIAKSYVSDTGSDKATDAASEQISKATADHLETYLENQCRYQLVKLDGYRNVLGGVAVIDQLQGSATIWLTIRAHGGEQAHVVMGSASGLPEEGTHSAYLHMQFGEVRTPR